MNLRLEIGNVTYVLEKHSITFFTPHFYPEELGRKSFRHVCRYHHFQSVVGLKEFRGTFVHVDTALQRTTVNRDHCKIITNVKFMVAYTKVSEKSACAPHVT
jgi:hypothetical protein